MSAPSVSAGVYIALTCVMGRRVLASLGESVASDPGDPLLNAAILAWNAVNVPLTDAWYQFPIFHPTRDALVLSEHLLGLSVIATPLNWTTGNALAAYNLTLLLSYPLCGMAMYALAWRLTRSHAAAFLAGLAFAFAPYRTSQLPHIQVLAAFWAPLALLGLHAFVETGRRRWLVLFGAAWLFQGASNGYFLVFFSALVGMWLVWFVVLRQRWRDLASIGAAGLAAGLPLAPVLYRYLAAQRELGLTRNLGEIAAFGADIAAPLCAPASLTFWGWVRVACAPEGELFAGAALIVLCAAGGYRLRSGPDPSQSRRAVPPDGAPRGATAWAQRRIPRTVRRVALVIAVVYIGVAIAALAWGPWRIDLGLLRASASSADKPLSMTVLFLVVALFLSGRFHRVIARGSIPAFYLLAALVCWILSWGPFPRFLGEDALYQAPYAWLLQLPGVDGLRVPARFWMLSLLCLIVFMAMTIAPLLQDRRGRIRIVLVGGAAAALLADGWTTINAAPVAGPAGVAGMPRGRTVLVLPVGRLAQDIDAAYAAVAGGWRTVNGFSGYEPGYYEALRTLFDRREDVLFEPFRTTGPLDVLASEEDPLTLAFVAGQPGAELVRRHEGAVHYRLPQRRVVQSEPVLGDTLAIHGLRATCSAEGLPLAIDRDLRTQWVCGPQLSDHELTVDLGEGADTAGIVYALGTVGASFPRELIVETSADGAAWEPAWRGSPAGLVLRAALTSPRETRMVLPFTPRAARFVRLRQVGRHEQAYWSVAELEVRRSASPDTAAVATALRRPASRRPALRRTARS